MAIGDQQDVFKRIKSVIPRWFGDIDPVLDSLINGLSESGAFVYSLYAYAKLQTRIRSATDGFLDMISADFFGALLPRRQGQSDTSYRNRIIISLFRERATRNGVIKVLEDLTGRTPRVFEPLRPLDTGAYSAPNWGYSVAGGYGSMLLPYQAFITAYRPLGTGIPNVGGYGATLAGTGYPIGGQFIPEPATPAPGGYGVGAVEWASLSMIQGQVSDAEIYESIDQTKPAATVIWTAISN